MTTKVLKFIELYSSRFDFWGSRIVQKTDTQLAASIPRISAKDITTAKIRRFSIPALIVVCLHFIIVYKTALFVGGEQFLLVKAYVLLTGLFLISRFFIIIFYEDSHEYIFAPHEYPSVSFVIAAKDEEGSIYKTIVACMESEYPALMELIAVDDGSSDNTRREMFRAKTTYLNSKNKVKVISFDSNRGKREAMAEGILTAQGEIVVFVDSDSFLINTGCRHIVEHFLNDQSVGAVAGNSGVENKITNALTKMQSARYGISFDIFKACESVFGLVTCCPGCFSAYRKDALLKVIHAWRTQTFLGTRSTFGDDRSLTNFILRNWDVVYCQSARAVTIVPDKYKKFMKQQLRWKKSWIREGVNAATFIWKRNTIAAISFYTNLLLPIFGPAIVFYAIVEFAVFRHAPIVFLVGVVVMSFVYGLFHFWKTGSRYWWYVMPFTIFYVSVLIWQMPYALLTLKDTRWGTR